jgi:beta-galactosidase
MTMTAAPLTDGRERSASTTLNTGWSVRRKATAFQELGGADGGGWTEVTLPHDALIGTTRAPDAPGGETNGYFHGGAFEYRRSLTVPAQDRGKRYFLEFDGVYRDAGVTINGAFAGQHAFGYSRFLVRIDPFLVFGGDNEIRVDCRTHLDSRWYAGAGIYRDVHLIVKEPVHIDVDGVRITTPDVDAARAVVVVDTSVRNDSTATVTAQLTTIAHANDGAEVARATTPITLLPGDSDVARQRLYVDNPALWEVDSPNLYTVRSELSVDGVLVDDVSTRIGIRTLQLDPRQGLRINGRTVKLRGACLHGDNGPLGAAAIAAAEERKIRLLKQAGFNAIRSSHHPASSALLDACDRWGMLVIDEAFDMWTSAKSDFDYAHDFPQWWQRDLESMVAKDFNHPSVIFYSIGNEIPETGDRFGARWGRRLAGRIRELDPGRFVTNGVNGFVSVMDAVLDGMRQRRDTAAATTGGVNQMMNDFGAMMGQIQASPMVTDRTEESFAVLDAAGLNYGSARYELDRVQFPDRVIIGTETYPGDIDQNWALVAANDHVIGDFTWTGLDYLGETGIGLVQYTDQVEPGRVSFSSRYPGLTAWCGDLDITGHRRPQSYYREIVFGLRTAPYIAVHRPHRRPEDIAISTPWSWSDTVASWSWPDASGDPVRVEVYADADEVELLLNRESLGRAQVGVQRAFRADFDVTYRPGELTAVAYRAGAETARTSLLSGDDGLTLTASADREEITADSSDLAFVTLTLTDTAGTVHTGRDRPVTVQITGPAVLQGLGSGNPVTADTFTAPTCHTFDGRALAIIRPTGTGTVTVTANAPDCATATLALTTR